MWPDGIPALKATGGGVPEKCLGKDCPPEQKSEAMWKGAVLIIVADHAWSVSKIISWTIKRAPHETEALEPSRL